MIYAANFKCNHTRKSFEVYAKKLDYVIQNKKISDEIIVFPNSASFLSEKFSFAQGAQNFYPRNNGPFTGEIGKEILDEFDIKHVLIGHSERRILGENLLFLQSKFEFAKASGYRIIFCVGESDIVKMNGNTKEFLQSQLKNIDLNYENLIIAYEPIWAIGTGKSAKISDIDEILNFLSTLTKAPLLYGGSVNPENINQILQIPKCSGVLVGTASLDVNNFTSLFNKK